MKNSRNRLVLSVFLLVLLFSWKGQVPAHAETKPISKGALFPDVSFTDVLTKEAQRYLELPRKKKFSLKDMKGSLFAIEVFSTYCMTCPKNVPVFNAAYNASRSDPALIGKVKVIGIAVGNTTEEVTIFNNEFKVSYPVLTDYSFSAHKAMGNVRVPFTLFVKRNNKGKALIVSTHQGTFNSAEDVLTIIRNALREP